MACRRRYWAARAVATERRAWEVPVCPPGQPDGRGLIAAEAPGRFDCLQFVEVELVDGLQRFGIEAGSVT